MTPNAQVYPRNARFWGLPVDHLPTDRSLVATGTASATTADALHALFLLQLRFGHATDAGRIEIGLFGLDAAKTAQLGTPTSQQVDITYPEPSQSCKDEERSVPFRSPVSSTWRSSWHPRNYF